MLCIWVNQGCPFVLYKFMDNQEIKYCIYARKSSESEDRQVQSIEDQISAMKKTAEKLGIKNIEIYRESKSAKKPYNRPVYTEMIKDIKNKKFNSIISWQLNRLSRNPIDSGELNWLLQTGVIKSILTIDKEYRSDDNVLLFNIESGMANQFIIDLKKNSMRGMKGKADRGWLPSKAPLGYLNDKLEHTIIPDPIRFSLVRKMWDIALSGKYSQQKIIDTANKWGLTIETGKNLGGTKIKRSQTYRMFANPFYTGNFLWMGKIYKGNHKPMITQEEFNEVQNIFGKNDRERSSKHEHAYKGVIKCDCGCRITAYTKTKKLITTQETKSYTFYKCTKRKIGTTCDSEQINETNLEEQIKNELQKYQIAQPFLDWAFESIDDLAQSDLETADKISEMTSATIIKLERELKNLTRMRISDLISDEEFITEKQRLENDILIIKDQKNKEDLVTKKKEDLKDSFVFLSEALDRLKNGLNATKKGVVLYFGSNHILKDKVFTLKTCDWMIPVRTSYENLKNKFDRFELDNKLMIQGQNSELNAIRAEWGA